MTRSLCTGVLLALLALAAPARAAGPEIGVADDRILLAGGPRADRTVAEWKANGVDDVRILALWSRIAPARRPTGFDARNPAAAGYVWGPLDAAVAKVRAAGMSVTLTVTGPGPLWTSSAPRRRRPAYKPRPTAYADFATAVARRYGGSVNRYVLWNEPNIARWLEPQASCRRRRCTPVSPHVYRKLVRAAYPAIHAADRRARVLIGAVSPRGQDLRRANATLRPLAFVRALGCVTSSWRRTRTGLCRGFKPARGDGFAIHPHGSLTPPDRPLRPVDDVGLADLPDLARTLDRLQRRGALRASTRRFGLYVDEYGYQTNPPDRAAGVSLRTQDRFLQRAAYLAWRTGRVKLLTQYLWRDEPKVGRSLSGWQSGVRFASGRAKPSLAHFARPFVADRARGRLWGQIRPGGAHRVTIQRRLRGGRWRTIATVRTDARGYWSLRRPLQRDASYRQGRTRPN